MNVLQVIQQDHDTFRTQLAEMTGSAKTAPDRSVEIFRDLYQHLVAHHTAEERLLFTKLKDVEDARSAIEEAWEEHEAIDLYLQHVKQSHKSERWEGKTAVLKELVEHHLQEEEEEVFELIDTHLGGQLEKLGEQFEKR